MRLCRNIRPEIPFVVFALLGTSVGLNAGPLDLEVSGYNVDVSDLTLERIFNPSPEPVVAGDMLVISITEGYMSRLDNPDSPRPIDLTVSMVVGGSYSIGDRVVAVVNSVEGVLRVYESPAKTWHINQANFGSMFAHSIYRRSEGRVGLILPVTLTLQESEESEHVVHTALAVDFRIEAGKLVIDRATIPVESATRKYSPHSLPLESLGNWEVEPEEEAPIAKRITLDCCYAAPGGRFKCGADCGCIAGFCDECETGACQSFCWMLGC